MMVISPVMAQMTILYAITSNKPYVMFIIGEGWQVGINDIGQHNGAIWQLDKF
jgi:hypothetical protein